MTRRSAYSYVVLQYVHDVVAGEALNIGVAMYVPSERLFQFELRRQIGRVKDAFPDLDGDAYKAEVAHIRRVLAGFKRNPDGLVQEHEDAAGIMRHLFPAYTSAFRWTNAGGGLTRDPEKEFAALRERFLERYLKGQARHRRPDEAIWAPIRDALTRVEVDVPFEAKTVASESDEITFEHAWKNGVWHVYEPVSLDYADADGVRERARALRGQLEAALHGVRDEFALNVIIGMPPDAEHKLKLAKAIDAAKAIIAGAPGGPRIWIEESQRDDLVAEIAQEARAHQAEQGN